MKNNLKPGQIVIDDLELPFKVIRVKKDRITLRSIIDEDIEVSYDYLKDKGYSILFKNK